MHSKSIPVSPEAFAEARRRVSAHAHHTPNADLTAVERAVGV